MPVRAVKDAIKSWIRLGCWRVYQIGRHVEERRLPAFATRPKNLHIQLPRRIFGAERIAIGDDVSIGPGSLLVALERYPATPLHPDARARPVQTFSSRIVIGNRVTSTGALTLAAHREIVVEDDVLLAANVNITDGLHGYASADEPYKDQPIFRIAPIRIGRGSWIGQNVQVLPGVSIGELCIIGANSVVTRSIPPRCIAVGAPARVVKRWRAPPRGWVPVEPPPAANGDAAGAAERAVTR